MLMEAVEAEVQKFLSRHASLKDGKRKYERSAHTTRTIRKSLFQRASSPTFDYISSF